MIVVYIHLLFLTLSTTLTSSLLHRQSLNGQWSATSNKQEIINIPNATVPGGIFSDLFNNGLIGDIFYGTGDTDYNWVGQMDWTYTTTFTVDEEFLALRYVLIIFEGIDTFSTISINGVEVGTTQNMFARYLFDIKELLHVGANEISVVLYSPIVRALALATDNTTNAYVVPPECPPDEYHGICYVNRIRKMQASFSWDWGPAFASVGIWKDVYLEAFDEVAIDYLIVEPMYIKPENNAWYVLVVAYLLGDVEEAVSGELEITLHLQEDVKLKTQPVSSNQQQRIGEFEIIYISSTQVSADLVDLWWPNGYGSQPLYNVTVTFLGQNETHEQTVRIGFRTVELVQEELDQGYSFQFKINDQPIFAKGSNEIPINILPEKGQDPDAVRNLMQTVRDTHMNMIRVWGGGVYESDYFYDLADEYGILIWQDFMFACAMYPSDAAFLKNVKNEINHQMKRLGNHPSIVIWAGNNENEAALAQNWYGTEDNFTLYKDDYRKLYVNLIKQENLRTLDTVVFLTSSPTNGRKTEEEDFVSANPADPLYGDVHFYDYRSDSWNVSTFPIPRFASEYGYQSMPSVESWLTATDSLENLTPDSDFLYQREHHPNGNQENLDLINLQLELPDPSSENYVQAFIYYSQIIQAQSVKIETEHYRSFKGRVDENGQGNTSGALYWQLNDVWVAPTWSGMDYTGRWKMLQYYTQDFFNPMIVTGRLTNDDLLEIYAIYDGIQVPDVNVKAAIDVYRWESLDPLVTVEFPVDLDPLVSVLVTRFYASTLFVSAGCGSDYTEAKTNCFFHLHLRDQDNNDLVPLNYVFPEKLKNCNLASPNLQISSVTASDEDGTVFDIVVTTDAVALFVWLDSHDIRGRFSENGFLHVLPTKRVSFIADEPTTLEDFKAALTVTHLRDATYFDDDDDVSSAVNLLCPFILIFLLVSSRVCLF